MENKVKYWLYIVLNLAMNMASMAICFFEVCLFQGLYILCFCFFSLYKALMISYSIWRWLLQLYGDRFLNKAHYESSVEESNIS